MFSSKKPRSFSIEGKRQARSCTLFSAVLKPYQKPSERAVRVVRLVKSRLPRLLERRKKRETEWMVWKEVSHAEGGSVEMNARLFEKV
jgi:hypothetical protein